MNPPKNRIWLSSPHMGGSELKYINEAFSENWIAPLGPNVDNFEKELANATGSKHVAVLSSGTSAIHLALILLGVEHGDTVLCQSFTFSASANPIAYQGAVPVFVGSEAETWNMDSELLERAIQDKRLRSFATKSRSAGQKSQDKSKTARPQDRKTARLKAIIAVHLYGMPAKMDEINAIASKYNIPVIEDAAEALGSQYKGKPVGTNGKFGILSFNGNKIITTSGGGALLSDDEDMIKRARFLSTQSRDKAPHYQHSQIGYNYRMSNIVAGIGRGQLEVLEQRVNQRRANNTFYRNLLKGVPGVEFQTEPSSDFHSNYWLTTITIDPLKAGTDREKLRLAFETENIEARPLWKPMHLQPVFASSPYYTNEIEEKLFANGLCLPSGSNLTKEELGRIGEVVKRVFGI